MSVKGSCQCCGKRVEIAPGGFFLTHNDDGFPCRGSAMTPKYLSSILSGEAMSGAEKCCSQCEHPLHAGPCEFYVESPVDDCECDVRSLTAAGSLKEDSYGSR